MHAWRSAFVFGCVLFLGCLSGSAVFAADLGIAAPAFGEGKPIPSDYSYKGGNQSPELQFSRVPAQAKSLVLIVDDPDSPSGLWTHWILWNIPAGAKSIPAASVPDGAVQGKNSFGNSQYDGPVPPSGTHRYYFHLYALDTTLSLPSGSSREEVESAMQGHVIAEGEMFGTYAASP
jgi:Raf kinase inhibitor-like YbhB/YbcL family protein